MNLQEPERKMSKSAGSPQGVIGLMEDPKDIERKVKRAVTDADDGPDAVRFDPVAKPGVSNLLELLATVTGSAESPSEVAGRYTRYGPLKADLAAAVLATIEPIQARYRELESDPGYVAGVLRSGAERARDVAAKTLQRAYDAVGLLPGA